MDIMQIITSINWWKLVNILFTLVFLAIGLKFIKTFIHHAFDKLKSKARNTDEEKNLDTLKLISQSALNFLLCIFVFINILNQLGVDVRPIITAAGVVGVAVGFGSKKFVEDLISGLTILLEGQVRVGDVIEVQGISGTVEKVTLCLIIIRSVDGTVHYIRNGMVDIISNYTREFSFALMDITVAYKENIAHVMEILKGIGQDLAQSDEFKNKVTGEIEILGLDKFNDSSITIAYRIKTLPKAQWEVKRAFNLKVKEKFDELGIEIPFNQLVVTNNN